MMANIIKEKKKKDKRDCRLAFAFQVNGSLHV